MSASVHPIGEVPLFSCQPTCFTKHCDEPRNLSFLPQTRYLLAFAEGNKLLRVFATRRCFG